VIEVRALSKSYRVAKKAAGLGASLRGLFAREYQTVEAVRELSFEIAPGARVGFLGPNGAGKTTTLKMLSGLLTPTSGEARVLGLDPVGRPRELLRQITLVMGQKQQLLWDLPPIETMELNRAVYEIDRADYARQLGELTEMLELSAVLEKPTRQLSLGERMKCELAAALLHRPKVLFLDEPTIGLDVEMQATVRQFIRRYNESTGATVILTSHYMQDVDALCPRVIVIDRGRLRYDGSLEALVAREDPDKLIGLRLARPVEDAVIDALGLDVVERSPARISVRCKPAQVTQTLGALLAALPVADLEVEDPPLETTMAALFRRGDDG